jgi:hypothetical protein
MAAREMGRIVDAKKAVLAKRRDMAARDMAARL